MSDYVLPLTLAFLGATVVGYFGRLLFASKCTHIECCYGACTVDRQTKQESKDIQLDLSMTGIPPKV
jgi:hypothetical protein